MTSTAFAPPLPVTATPSFRSWGVSEMSSHARSPFPGPLPFVSAMLLSAFVVKVLYPSRLAGFFFRINIVIVIRSLYFPVYSSV